VSKIPKNSPSFIGQMMVFLSVIIFLGLALKAAAEH
jgi:hypothetical protein